MIELSRFIDYPLWFKAAALIWLALTVFLGASTLFVSPKKSERTPATNTARQNSHEPQLAEPRFSEEVETFTFSIGERGISVGYDRQTLESTHVNRGFAFGGYRPVDLYIENGQLYADVTIYGGSGLPPITIKKNKLSNKPPDWDFNSNENALEIVDANNTPVYQFFYKTPSHIVMNGIFPYPGGLILANEKGAIQNPIIPTTFKLKPIFKYPSWKYPGQYAE